MNSSCLLRGAPPQFDFIKIIQIAGRRRSASRNHPPTPFCPLLSSALRVPPEVLVRLGDHADLSASGLYLDEGRSEPGELRPLVGGALVLPDAGPVGEDDVKVGLAKWQNFRILRRPRHSRGLTDLCPRAQGPSLPSGIQPDRG